MKLRGPYNYDRDAASRASDTINDNEEMAQQQFKEETDINTIVRRFGITGELPNGVNMPRSGDFTGVTDYQTAMNIIRQAEEAFMEIPGETRERFQHNPQKVMEFLANEDNRAEAIKLGLVEKPPEQTRPPEPLAT